MTDIVEWARENFGLRYNQCHNPSGPEGGQFCSDKTAEYAGQHRPPGPDYGAPLHNLTQGGLLPDDVYTHPEYYDFAGDGEVLQNWRIFNAARDRPNALVTVYRSLPQGKKEINTGDWVALRPEYAASSNLDPTDPAKDMPVIASMVHAKDVWTAGDSFDEFGYWGPTVEGVRFPKRLYSSRLHTRQNHLRYNQCHNPSGPEGGQFCSDPQGGETKASISHSDDLPTALKTFREKWPQVKIAGITAKKKGDDVYVQVPLDEVYDKGKVYDTLPVKGQEQLVGMFKGVDEVLSEYPDVADHLEEIGVGPTDNTWTIAETTPKPFSDKDTESVIFNNKFLFHPETLQEGADMSATAGFHPDNFEFYPGYSASLHEMGHVLDQYGGQETSTNVYTTLQEAYYDQHPSAVGYHPVGGGPDFEIWVRENLPGYSFNSYGSLSRHEAVAEAYLDVKLNGKDATEPNRVINDDLLNNVRLNTTISKVSA